MRDEVSTPQQAVQFLRRHHAKPGAVEAAFAFDSDTGIVLDFAVGSEDSVDLDESKLQHCANVVVLHSHPVNAATTQYDWQHFLGKANLRELIVVSPSATYVLSKPPDWTPNFQWRKSPFDDWEDYAISVSVERGISDENPPTPKEWEEITIEINRRMARQYGLNFSWQREEETT